MLTENTLRLDRFCGFEIYKIEDVEVFVSMPDESKEISRAFVEAMESPSSLQVSISTSMALPKIASPSVEIG